MIRADVRTLKGEPGLFDVVLASPPCQQFSQMLRFGHNGKDLWARPKDMSLVNAAFRIAGECRPRHWVIENVRDARPFFPEPARCHRGAFYLWGEFPPFQNLKLPPKIGCSFMRSRPSWSVRGWNDSRDPALRALIPYPLSLALCLAMEAET